MVNLEKGVGRVKDSHFDTQYSDRGRRRSEHRGKMFYKQPAIRNRRCSAGGAWALDSGKLPLASGCDGNRTLEKQAAYNLNIMRKLSLNILKLIEVGSKTLSLKKKRYAISTNPGKHLEQIMNM